MRTEIAVPGWERWRREVDPPGKADRVATRKLVNLGGSRFLKLDSHIVTRVRWRGTPITSVSSGKEMTLQVGPWFAQCGGQDTGMSSYIAPSSPTPATAVLKSGLGGLLG